MCHARMRRNENLLTEDTLLNNSHQTLLTLIPVAINNGVVLYYDTAQKLDLGGFELLKGFIEKNCYHILSISAVDIRFGQN